MGCRERAFNVRAVKCQALSNPVPSVVDTEQYYGSGAVAAGPSDGL